MAYFDKYGVEFSDDRKTLIKCPEDFQGEYIVPEETETINAYAFEGCKNLRGISIHDNVESIGNCAFSSCKSLTFIKLPESIKRIEYAVFRNCTNLYSVIIPNNVICIEQEAFRDCCNLMNIIIPQSVKSIGYGAFYGCSGLEIIVVSHDNPVYDSRENCNAIIETNTLIVGCKNTIIPKNITSIEYGAFFGCKDLKNITVPDSIKNIKSSAFSGCEGLPIVDNIRYADSYLVEAVNKEQATYCIKHGTKWIGSMAFHACTNLERIFIPISVLHIGESAFRECLTLKEVFLPNSITNIENNAFDSCESLTSITIPDRVSCIGWGAFAGCKALTNITIGNGVIYIENHAFEGCKSLKQLIIPLGVKEIGGCAFRYCENLESITLPVSENIHIEYDAFESCKNLKIIRVPKGQKESFLQMGFEEFADIVVECEEEQESRITKRTSCNDLENKINTSKYLFFDTETTGVPRNYKAPMQDTANWPRLVQLAWLLVDERGIELKRKSVIIRPDGFTIPEEAVQVHGITTERAQNEGFPLWNVLDEFMQDLELAEEIVGHNIDFDIHIVGAELCRLDMSTQKISNKPTTCTMKSFTNFCAIPSNNGYGGYKWPTLEELYYKVFGCGMENAHDALADILATKECFFELKNRFQSKASSVPMSGKRTDLSDLPF